MRALSKSAAAGLTAAALVGAGVGAAFADGIVLDGDSITSAGGGTLDLGTVACSTTVTSDVLVAAVRRGNGDKADPVFQNGATVAVSVSAVSGTGLSASMGTDATIALESSWTSFANNYVSADTATSSVRLSTSTTAGAGSGVVTFTAAGTATDGDAIRRSETLKVAWTTAPCPTNTTPSAPGAPVASASPTQGGFSLSWAASSDTEGNAVTYTLEGKDADDSGFSTVASGLTTPSYGFAAGTPAEGTWTYRVKAVESTTSPALQSGWSADSQPVVVDRTVPNAPSASADRAAEYSGTTGDWWKDSVTVSFAGNGDPALPDTSAGSGVASVTDAQTFATTGGFTAQGTATDNVGLTSSVTSFSGSVDATAPEVSLQCPISVVKGSTAYATWTASDLGSGLATATSGQIALDTSAVGSRSVSAPAGTAVDNVGHASVATAPCTYSVVYDFRGFFQPVDNIGWNVAKAGSAIPIKFSLNGFQGLDIIAAGSPTFTITGTSQNGDAIEEVVTATAGGSSLSYDADSDQYVYVWKTSKDWAGKSGTFTLKLNDGTSHTAKFSFKK